MAHIDPAKCVRLVQDAADAIAAAGPRAAREAPLGDLIAQVRLANATAKESLSAALAALYPSIGWTDEEERPSQSDAEYWLYDPIDGAYHYLQGLPLWSSSLALVRGDEVLFSIVYDPTLREAFTATAGAGASLNGRPARVSPKSNLKAAVLGSAIAPLAQVGADAQAQALALLGVVAREVFVVRPMAATSLQLAYVAAGRLDGYWETGSDAEDWLAGSLLVREAGGVVTDLQGGASLGWNGRGVAAANPRLHAELMPLLGQTP